MVNCIWEVERMRRKIIGILICMLLIATAIPVIGQVKNIYINKNNNETNPTNNGEKWMKTYDFYHYDTGKSVIQTDDGGYIVVGSTTRTRFSDLNYDIFLLKTDSMGNEIWKKTFGGDEWDMANCIKQTSDGGYIITGHSASYGAGEDDVWLIKTDNDGNKLWDKTFDNGKNNDTGNDVIEIDSGEFIILGSTRFGDIYNPHDPEYNHDIWLIKTDSNGEMIWDTIYDRDDQDSGATIHELDDGGFIIAGDTSSLGYPGYADILLIKTDSEGEVIWDKTFSKNLHDYGFSLGITSDGGFAILGNTYDSDPLWYNVWLIKTDSNGELIWDKTYGNTGLDWASSMQITSDGGFIIAGYFVRFINADAFLLKINNIGEQEWIKTYDKTRNDIIHYVQQTSEGGYILTGNVDSMLLNTDVWLVKTDENGDAPPGKARNLLRFRLFELFPNLFPILRQILLRSGLQ
jgi:hypothetical protein